MIVRAAWLVVLLGSLAVPAFADPRPPLAEPAPSPDGSTIVFASGGDLWTVAEEGGDASLLVSHPATESRPLYSPDGTEVAFVSTRSGNGDLYVLTLATGALRRVTWDDAPDLLDAWSPDGRFLYFSSVREEIAGMTDVFRVPAAGGLPVALAADRYLAEFGAAPAPEGGTVAFSARGVAFNQWWRHGSSHLDESELWRRDAEGRATRLSVSGAKHLWPLWAPAGDRLYFVSDRDGHENLWQLDPRREATAEGDGATPLTRFTDGRVLWPALSADGGTLTFERDFEIWSLALPSGVARAVPVRLVGTARAETIERTSLGEFSELALSPDGKKLALVARGEVFAASAVDGGNAVRITRTAAAELEPTWAPDSRTLAYVSERGGKREIFAYDFTTRTERRLAEGDAPLYSPDGKLVAYLRDGREVRTMAPDGTGDRQRAAGAFGRPPLHDLQVLAFSPDSAWLAFASHGERMFRNLHGIELATERREQLSFLANAWGSSVAWSPDGTFLLYDSRQRTEPGVLARIDLVPAAPKFREDRFRDLFTGGEPEKPATEKKEEEEKKDATPTAPKPVRIEAEGLRQRLEILPVGLDVNFVTIAPDGKTAILLASVAGRQNLYSFPLDPLSDDPAVAKQLTSTRGDKGKPAFSPDGAEIFFLDDGAPKALKLAGGDVRSISVQAEIEVDFAVERGVLFDQTWTYLAEHFYDSAMHGADWPGQGARHRPYAEAAATRDELRRVLSLLIGELDASHTGIRAPGSESVTVTGRLGLRFDSAELERSGRARVAEVVALGPADLAGVKAGEVLVAIEGTALAASGDPARLLDGRIGKRTELTVLGADGKERTVAVLPIDLSAEKTLLYRQWVEQKRRYVETKSGGKLGYVHLLNMSADAFAQLLVDLDTANQAKEGVVVDIRNNNGGFVHAYTLDVLARRPFLTMTFRGMAPAPARAVLGQRSLERPTVLVTNQHSLSDAEDMSEGYRALGLGPIVGEPTAGWIIYTSNVDLLDGSSLRLPFIGVADRNGENMERAPRPVDIPVTRPVGEPAGEDIQLDVAVRELLGRLGTGQNRP
jgi:Tol biopolymer transport system component/C-terminal processing protease CtpA/Prc